jgi:O-antigen/teichoic acid export membrane protein
VSGAIFFYGLYHLASTSLFLKERMLILPVIWAVAILGCAGASLYLVPRFGIIGAAAGQLLAFAIVTIATFYASWRVVPFRLSRRWLVLAFALAVVLIAALSRVWAEQPVLSALLKLPVVLASAAAISRLFLGTYLPLHFIRQLSGGTPPEA